MGFIRDGKGGCGFYKRRERCVCFIRDGKGGCGFIYETGRVGIGFIRNGRGGCGFYKRPEGWAWVL